MLPSLSMDGGRQAAAGPPTISPRPDTLSSLSSSSAVAPASASVAPRLKHAWPSGLGQLGELTRKLGMLQTAVRRTAEGVPAAKAPAKAFQAYCARANRPKGSLSYEDLDRAWRHMEGAEYSGLTFRHAVAARPSISRGCQQVLIDAKCSDTEQTICFMKMLDRDCDGRISEKDFAYTMSHCHTPWWRASTLMGMEERWHAAAVALEKPSTGNPTANKFLAAMRRKKSNTT